MVTRTKTRTYRESSAYYEFVDSVVERVKDIPIEDIVGAVVKLYPRGPHLLGLCPFHPDNNLGSFVVTPAKKLWMCFAEGIGGSGIKFEMEYYSLSFLDAVFKLAVDHDIITEKELENYRGRKIDATHLERLQQSTEIVNTVEEIIAPENIIKTIYGSMFAAFQLSDEHKRHLLEVRGLTEEDLEGNYITFPSRRINIEKRIIDAFRNELATTKFKHPFDKCSEEEKDIIEGIEQKYGILDQIKYVPGFFYDKNQKKIDFVSYSGIGIAVRDDTGKIRGIQIRRDKIKNGESRYIWFSSSFAKDKEDYVGGASPHSPGGVIFPKNVDENPSSKHNIFITEGRFKAEQIAKHGNIAVYVSGVSTWKSVLPIVERLLAKYKTDTVYLAFDADILSNVAVHKQLGALSYELKRRGLLCKVVLWDQHIGKGMDDLILARPDDFSKFLVYVGYDDFERKYKTGLSRTLAEYHADNVRDISVSEVDRFTSDLQKCLLSIFEIPTI